MPSITTISVDKLARLVGTPHCPALIDVRTDGDYNADPHLIPSSMRRPYTDPSAWMDDFAGRSAIVICQKGAKLSEGVAAWLRHAGVSADALEHGFEGWRKAGLPLVTTTRMPVPCCGCTLPSCGRPSSLRHKSICCLTAGAHLPCGCRRR